MLESELLGDPGSNDQRWFAILENPNAQWRYEDIVVQPTVSGSKSGLALPPTTITAIDAGERMGIGGVLDEPIDTGIFTLSIDIDPVRAIFGASAPPISVSDITWRSSDEGNRLTALIRSEYLDAVSDLLLVGVVRDSRGLPLDVRTLSMSYLPPQDSLGVVLPFGDRDGVTIVELYAIRTSDMEFLPVATEPGIDVVGSGTVVDEFERELYWTALLQNQHSESAITDSHLIITLLDSTGAVIAVENLPVPSLAPGQRTAIIGEFESHNPEDDVAGIKIHTQPGRQVVDTAGTLALEDVLYLDDQGVPRAEGFIRSTLPQTLLEVEIRAIAFDEAERIVGIGVGLVPEVPSFGWAFGQAHLVLASNVERVDRVEMFAIRSASN